MTFAKSKKKYFILKSFILLLKFTSCHIVKNGDFIGKIQDGYIIYIICYILITKDK